MICLAYFIVFPVVKRLSDPIKQQKEERHSLSLEDISRKLNNISKCNISVRSEIDKIVPVTNRLLGLFITLQRDSDQFKEIILKGREKDEKLAGSKVLLEKLLEKHYLLEREVEEKINKVNNLYTHIGELQTQLLGKPSEVDLEIVKEDDKDKNVNEKYSVEQNNIRDYIPLIHAAKNRFLLIVENLLSDGSEINQVDILGESALMKASENGYYSIVEYLLDQEPNINLQNKKGETALHLAINKNRLNIVKLLVEKGAQLDIKNQWDRTPIILAEKEGLSSIMEYLKIKMK